MIPKIIHCAWVGDKPMPTQGVYLDTWRALLPDYDIRVYGTDDLPDSPCVRAMMARGKPVTAAQYMCFLKLYEHGGIYLDLDIDVRRSFDTLLRDALFIGCEVHTSGKVDANCGVIGAEARHPFLDDVLTYMDNADYDMPSVEVSLGPQMFTTLLKQYGWDGKDRDALVRDMRVYDRERFHPYPWNGRFDESCVTDRTFAVHRWAFTWNPKKAGTKVSVVIPCFQQGRFLEDAIESTLQQTVPAHEVIVVDDGSTDDTAKVATRYPVRYIHKPNGGLSAARNTGIAAATGTHICTLDADDMLDPRYIESLLGLDDVASSTLQCFGASNGVWRPPLEHPTVRDFVKHNRIMCASLFRRAVWEKIGGFDEDMHDGYEDWDFWTRAAAAGFTFTCVPETLFYYRKHDTDRTGTTGSIDRAQSKDAEIKEYLYDKWTRLGVYGRPIAYPVTLGVEITHDGVLYPKGLAVDRSTALMLKDAGHLHDPRIV